MTDQDVVEIKALLRDLLTRQTQLGVNIEDVRAHVARLETATTAAQGGVKMALATIESAETAIDRRLAAIESRTAPLQTIASQMVDLTAGFNALRDGIDQQIQHEVTKALDDHLPIERLAAAQR